HGPGLRGARGVGWNHPGRGGGFDLRPDGDPESLRHAAHLFGDHFLDQFLSPAETTFIQPTDRPFQGHLDDDVRVPGGVRHAAEHAGALVELKPGRALYAYKPALLDVPEARHLLALHDAQAQVPQRPDDGDLMPELRADLAPAASLPVDEGTGGGGVVGRPAPLPLVI